MRRTIDFHEFAGSAFRRRHLYRDAPPVAGWEQPIHRPHYSDERFSGAKMHTLYGSGDVYGAADGVHYVYSDRLWEWDYDKAKKSSAAADASGARSGSPHWWREWLTHYEGRPIELVHIVGGVNVSSGYEYFCFGYTTPETEEHTP